MSGMRASKTPNATPTRILVRASIPLRPIPIAPAKLLRPTDTLTSSRPNIPDTGVTIWRRRDSAFCWQRLTKTLCRIDKSDSELHRICKRPCHPKLGSQSLKPYNPPHQERYEAQAARTYRGHGRGLTSRHDRSRQANFHAQRGFRDPGGPSADLDDVRALGDDPTEADGDESPALLAPGRDEAAGHPDAHSRASRQSRRRSLHPCAAQAASQRGCRSTGWPEKPGRVAARRLNNPRFRVDGRYMSKKRRRLEIKVEPLPAPFQDETASCPVCGRDAAAIGRRHLQIVFRCEGCKVVFKRNRSWPYIY